MIRATFWITLFYVTHFILGCSSFYHHAVSYLPIDKEEAMLLSKQDTHWMRRQDYERFKKFIETAPANELTQTVRWYCGISRYTASSQEIFVDPNTGQPCRCYTIECKPLFSRATHCVEIACRNFEGQWIKRQ